MPRSLHLALALILMLMLAPLARATCGITCLAAIPHPAAPLATSQTHCVRATACCHSRGPAVCAAAQSSESIAALLSTGTKLLPETPAIAVRTAEASAQHLRALAARNIDTSPPGDSRASAPTPLRI